MRRSLTLFAGLALAIVSVAFARASFAQTADPSKCAAYTNPNPDAVVILQNNSFTPNNVTLAKSGMEVCWEHEDPGVSHTVTFDPPTQGDADNWPSCNTGTGTGCFHKGDNAYVVVFSTNGSFRYHCKVHPSMTGVVTVGSGAPPVGTTTPTTKPGASTTTTAKGGATATTVGAIASETTTTSTTVEATTTSLPLTTQTTSSALGKTSSDDDEPSVVLKTIGVLLLAAVVAALIPSWRRLT